MAVVVVLGAAVVVGLLVPAIRNGTGTETSSASYSMAGVGMEPTLDEGQRVTARDIDGAEVERGDVVVLQAPGTAGNESILTIKRVVAVAGDEIASTPGGEVLINGEPTPEPYLAAGTTTLALLAQEVPEGHVFVMGDNRLNSSDSRVFGSVPYEAIEALVET